MLLNNEWVNNEIKDKIKKYLKTNENERTTTKNLGDTIKAFQINNLTLYYKNLKNNNKEHPDQVEGRK